MRKDDCNSEKIRKSGGKMSLAPTFNSSVISTKSRDNRKSSRKQSNIQHRSRTHTVSNVSAGFESNPTSGSSTRSSSIDFGNQADKESSSVSSTSSPGKSKVLQFHSSTATTLNLLEGET